MSPRHYTRQTQLSFLPLWPQFRDLSADEFANHLKQTFVLDPSGFIAKNLANDKRIQYFSVGVPS